MADDPYRTLGIDRTASRDEVKAAYRKLAKSLHPDLNPGDAGKQARFREVAAAYDILGDPEKRSRYDAGEIDGAGQARAEPRFRDPFGGAAGRRDGPGARQGFGDMSDLFSDFFGRARGARRGAAVRGADIRYEAEVDFLEAACGAKRVLTMSDANRIELAIPAGLEDGQVLRLRGKGGQGQGGGEPGDALVTVAVRPHPVFVRAGADIEVELPITVDEAVLGAKVEVPTISGLVTVTVPRGVSSGRRLRLKGKGIAMRNGTGDQVVRLKIVLPGTVTPELEELARTWKARAGFDPRRQMRKET